MMRLLESLRRLRVDQLYWKARYAAERRLPMSARRAAGWRWHGELLPRVSPFFPEMPLYLAQDAPHQSLGLLQNGVFRFLNEEHATGYERPDWQIGKVQANRLWTINLHYHAWAFELADMAAWNAAGAREADLLFEHYVDDWIRHCPLRRPGSRDLAWNAYATATRITWWIRAWRALGAERFAKFGDLHAVFLKSLWQQSAYLADHLELDLRANHLLRDACGLAWAARFFDEPRTAPWLAKATELALAQASEQVLPDGGHFERSPMYHVVAMEDFLSLSLLLTDESARESLRQTWLRMAEYLAWMRHPDARIPLFNDSAFNGAMPATAMLELGRKHKLDVNPAPRSGLRHFADSGMVVWHGKPWSVFFDVGPVGPDCQPGHAHADTLSLECSLNGHRLFVDPGTFHYDRDDVRRYDRATASHNTVAIDGLNSSDVWNIFRVGQRARPMNVAATTLRDSVELRAAHDGFDRLHGNPRHSRIIVIKDKKLVIRDRIEGEGRHQLEGGFLLGPDWKAAGMSGGWEISDGQTRARMAITGAPQLWLLARRRPYHPEFGSEEQTTRVCWQLDTVLPAEITTTVDLLP